MKNKGHLLFVIALAAATLLTRPQPAFAKDDFGKIVKHIEVTYHVHRQHRWVMGIAGFVVKVSHIGGVKSFKGAIFENQPFVNAASDTRFNEVMREAMDSGWQPIVQEWDRHSGERTYVYAQDLGKDLRVLVVSLESNDAVVIQVKVNPDKLQDFIREAGVGKHDRAPDKEINPPAEQTVEVADLSAQSWNGVCLQE
ncbi:MAG TPA: hypothetical protein VJW20_14020 [Candidatus Angelobacter sp.]|nr:hypothetical protein [Candidatus Angelobacter sp.]